MKTPVASVRKVAGSRLPMGSGRTLLSELRVPPTELFQWKSVSVWTRTVAKCTVRSKVGRKGRETYDEILLVFMTNIAVLRAIVVGGVVVVG